MFSKYRVTYKKLLSLFVLKYIKYFIKKEARDILMEGFLEFRK